MTHRSAGMLSLSLAAMLHVSACASRAQKVEAEPQVLSSTAATADGIAITDEMIGRSRGSMSLSQAARDGRYGYSAAVPVPVGGGLDEGAERTYRFLNALRGPDGTPIKYSRVGTCCPFRTPRSPFGGEAVLEVYQITIVERGETKRLYFDWYDEGDVLIPLGLTAAR